MAAPLWAEQSGDVIDSGAMEARAPDGGAIAFFDLDGTLVVGQTQRLLVSFLRRRGMVSLRFVVGVALWFVAYRLGLVKATDRARARGAELVAGHRVDEIEDLMDVFAVQVLQPRLHEGAVDALRLHQQRGEDVVIVSAALAPVVDALGRLLGVQDCEGTPLAVSDGVYTGRLAGRAVYGPEKVRVAREHLAARGVDPARCAAYADHETDVELLEAVGVPVAVSPRPVLAAIARERGWRILS
ncbi:MAG: HAD family hydrolase [Thermoleophilia bacterium]